VNVTTTGIYQPEPLLDGKFIFLSASKPSRNFELFPLSPAPSTRTSVEIEEAVVSLARAVFSNRGRLVFGGHPSISPLVASVAAEYFPARHIKEGEEPVWIYQSKAFEKVIPASTQSLEKLGFARIHWIERFGDEEYQASLAGQEQCLESLRKMREAMVELRPGKDQPDRKPLPPPVAMVAIGGMEGVVREASLYLEKAPGRVYTLGTTAGAALHLGTYLAKNLLHEERYPESYVLEKRVTVLEDEFPIRRMEFRASEAQELPLAPYAVLMQRMVWQIAEKRPPTVSTPKAL
jgi:hypothetical protein